MELLKYIKNKNVLEIQSMKVRKNKVPKSQCEFTFGLTCLNTKKNDLLHVIDSI